MLNGLSLERQKQPARRKFRKSWLIQLGDLDFPWGKMLFNLPSWTLLQELTLSNRRPRFESTVEGENEFAHS